MLLGMTSPSGRPTDISVRQFVADSGAVTRGLRQGRAFTLTLNGEPLARMIPIRQRRAVPKDEVLAIFATAPVVNGDGLRADLDEAVSQDLRDPYEGDRPVTVHAAAVVDTSIIAASSSTIRRSYPTRS
jgi:antitoxin (DNA-binding transcriptional repressor) of toxin-antitoxin stability system